jgi:hypothetical protein
MPAVPSPSEIEPSVRQAIDSFLARQHYYPCLLLVHLDPARLERVAGELATAYGWPRVEVGRELSAALLAEPPAQYPGQARRWLAGRLRALAPGPALVTGVDLLLEPALDVEPLLLLRRASRTTRLVVTWPGAYERGVLSYGVPQHAHYRTWAHPEVAVVALT